MAPSASDIDPEQALTEIAVSEDELEMLQLFRSMKHGVEVELEEFAVEQPLPEGQEEAIAAFDEALVIAHHATANHLQLGFVRLIEDGLQGVELIPISSAEEYGRVEGLWKQLTGEVAPVKETTKKSFLRYATEQFRMAEAVHKRAREVIARYDETSKKTDETMQRARDLLAHNNR